MSGAVCDTLFGELEFEEPENAPPLMIINSFETTLGGCSEGENDLFQGRYFSFFVSQIDSPFEYFITFPDGDTARLEITNAIGDIAVYNGALLSVNEVEEISFSVFPNPVQDQLFIETKNSLENYTVTVFDILGKAFLTTSRQKLNANPILVETWSSGMYFLRIEDQNGEVTTKRFIKN